jgi:hypothetical protein
MTCAGQLDTRFMSYIEKMRNNKIYEIEATGFTLPLNSPNGWSEFLRWRES